MTHSFTPPPIASGRQKAVTSATDAKRKITVCVKAVSGLLGNTPTVCRASYVHPKIFDLYESGTLADALPGSDTKGFEPAVIRLLTQR